MIDINPKTFGNCNKDLVDKTLETSVFILEYFSGVASPRKFLIGYKDDNPMCANYEDIRIIFLNINGDFFGQWAYQFAHEYCHHLIDGEMTGDICGLTWFEETLCELASRFVIALLSDESLCARRGLQSINHIFREYHDGLTQSHPDLHRQFRSGGGIRQWLPLLSEPRYHRDLYSVIASELLPLFLEHPHLWQIIGCIGDSRRYESPEALLAHLASTAAPEISDAVKELQTLLLGN